MGDKSLCLKIRVIIAPKPATTIAPWYWLLVGGDVSRMLALVGLLGGASVTNIDIAAQRVLLNLYQSYGNIVGCLT